LKIIIHYDPSIVSMEFNLLMKHLSKLDDTIYIYRNESKDLTLSMEVDKLDTPENISMFIQIIDCFSGKKLNMIALTKLLLKFRK
jgi:hypothetical protein